MKPSTVGQVMSRAKGAFIRASLWSGERRRIHVDALPGEFSAFPVPRKENGDPKGDRVTACPIVQPISSKRAGNCRLFGDSLRSYDDIPQLEVNVRKGGEQFGIELPGTIVTTP